MRLDAVLTEYNVKEKSLINMNQYVEDLKSIIHKLELKIIHKKGKEHTADEEEDDTDTDK